MNKVKQGLRYLHHCRTVGREEAARRYREVSETAKIRRLRKRRVMLTPRERRAQERAARQGGVRFQMILTEGGQPASGGKQRMSEAERVLLAEQRALTLRSLQEQTWPGETGPEAETAAYAAFFEPEDYLHPGALYACARAIQETGADLIYTDDGFFTRMPGDRSEAFYKPDYGPDSLAGCCYVGPFLVCSRQLLQAAEAEGLGGLAGEERREAVIRLAAKAKRVCHLPRVLYYRRVAEGAAIPEPETRRIRMPLEAEPLVSILIPSRDHREDLARCLDSIRRKTTYPRYEILVLENGSREAETFRYYEELKADPRVRVIPWEGEFNFSAVNNAGFREAKGEQILLLNNDTEVISGDWLQEMLMYAQRKDVGAVGAKLYYPDGTIQHAGIGLGIQIAAGHWHRGFPGDSRGYFGRLTYAQNVSAVTAACMMIPRRVYGEMQGLDEGFRVMFNDVDLCLRIRQAGYLIVWTPWAELTHHESKSRGAEDETREKQRFFVEETNRFLRKWHGALDAGDPYYNPNLTREREDFSLR